MPFIIKRLEDMAAYIVTLNNYNPKTENIDYYTQLTEILNAESQLVNIILVVSIDRITLDLVRTRVIDLIGSSTKTPYHHPNVKSLIIVSNNQIIKLFVNIIRKLRIFEKILITDSVDSARIM